MRYVRLLLCCVGCQVVLCWASWADELVFDFGKKIEGSIVSFQGNEVTFATGADTFVVSIKKIKTISTDSGDVARQSMVEDIRNKVQAARATSKARSVAIQNRFAGKKVEYYYLPGCPACAQMDVFLARNNIQYIGYNVEDDPVAKIRFHRKGARYLPYIVINGTVSIVGYEPEALMQALDSK